MHEFIFQAGFRILMHETVQGDGVRTTGDNSIQFSDQFWKRGLSAPPDHAIKARRRSGPGTKCSKALLRVFRAVSDALLLSE